MHVTAYGAAAAAPPRTTPESARIADQLEVAIFQQLLKSAGFERSGASAEGGIGEEQFTSFLTEEYARILAGRIDLHLMESQGK